MTDILITGARQHNLKNEDVRIPRDSLTVVTGLSGSGKSSLAFDTLYAEGQRRYVESLSAYARQFLDQMQKPEVDHIEGLSPAISIEQRTSGGNPRRPGRLDTISSEKYSVRASLSFQYSSSLCMTCGNFAARWCGYLSANADESRNASGFCVLVMSVAGAGGQDSGARSISESGRLMSNSLALTSGMPKPSSRARCICR